MLKYLFKILTPVFIILISTSAFPEETNRSIDQAGWENILSKQNKFTSAELINKSADLLNEGFAEINNGKTEEGLQKALAAFVISRHIQNITQDSDSNRTLADATNKLQDFLYKSGLESKTIENSYSSFIEHSTTAGVNIKHYSIEDTTNNSISPQRLHWPNTVINHYDNQGRIRGYSVLPARKRWDTN